LLWERVDSFLFLGANIVIVGIRRSGLLRGSTHVSKGAKLDMFNTTTYKPVDVTPLRTLRRYSKGFMPRVKLGGFVLQTATKPARV